jgi:serine phosphatase RsbU (regulator of sigma subunit)
MHETVRHLGNPDFFVTALVARWRAATGTLVWVNCGHPPAYLVDVDGNLEELEGPTHRALGTGKRKPAFRPAERQLRSGERLILVTDGVTRRRVEGGGQFGVEGLREALERAQNPTAASTAMAIQQAITDCWSEALEDDATVVVMAVD